MKKKKTIIVIVSVILALLLVTTISLLFLLNIKHSEEISNKIVSIGGELIKFESVDVQESPFESDSQGRNKIYKITYKKNGKQFIAWYRATKNPFNIHQPSSRSLEEKWIFDN